MLVGADGTSSVSRKVMTEPGGVNIAKPSSSWLRPETGQFVTMI
jgi:2-polyprenyl-6-methoxyphenol hydroxylase-like FAD-dependent oxidoreductase